MDELERCVKRMFDSRMTEKSSENPEQIAEEAAKQYDRKKMAGKYVEIYERLMRDHDKS